MNSKEIFSEMVTYDFSNLNLQQDGNDNCYCDNDGGCDGRCDRINTEMNAKEMVVYDFSNLNLGQDSNDNYYLADCKSHCES